MRRNSSFIALAAMLLCSCSHRYFIVRHAEKAEAGMSVTNDPPLTEKGRARAETLRHRLQGEHIRFVYSTNTARTKATAQPVAAYFKVPVELYGPRPDTAFIRALFLRKKNTLIVGHSNTIDDIVNMLCGRIEVPGDLKDEEYDNLFVVKVKGRKIRFRRERLVVSSE